MSKEPEFDINMFRPIESQLLDDAVDEYLNAEIDELAGIGESSGIDAMLDAEIDSMCESQDITFDELSNVVCESHGCDCDDEYDDDDEDDDDEDDNEEYFPSDDDYIGYSEVEVDEEDDDDE